MVKRASYEDARRCPACEHPGDITKNKQDLIGKCMNKRCKDFNSKWMIQFLSDGTIPLRYEIDDT